MTQPMIEVNDLVKQYKNATRNAVDGISFRVDEGRFFTLLGENGAGKTTTISILTTTLAPTSGQVRIAGHDIITDNLQVRQNVGIIFQKPSLDLNLTAEENVRMHAVMYGVYPFRPTYRLMPKAYRDSIGELAAILGLKDEMMQPVRTFSGGMKRKLEIIRSLMHKPRVLMLDEPTTGLDPSARRSLWEYLHHVRQQEGTTLLLTTHYLEEAEQADQICILSRGQVIVNGTREQIKTALVEEYLLIDSQDRAALRAELREKGIPFTENGRVRLDIVESEIHALLKRIDTPLNIVEPHAPSLEEAYLAITEKAEKQKATSPSTNGTQAEIDTAELEQVR